MAGAGFKTFVDGDILTASQVNTYLMEQAVMVFATSTARSTALPTPSEGMVTYRTDANVIEFYDGSAWQPIVNQDVIEAKGDLIVGTGDDAVDRLAVGTNGQILTADSSTATGLKWAAAAGGGGKVLQVVEGTTNTLVTNSSGAYADTGLTVTITPTAATSKVLVIACQAFLSEQNSATTTRFGLEMYRGATKILDAGGGGDIAFIISGASGNFNYGGYATLVKLDSPATTSATVYKLQGKDTSGTLYTQNDSTDSVIIAMEIGA